MQGITVKKENHKKPSKDSVTVSPAGNHNITSPFYETVLLRNKKGKLVFQFTFDVEKNTDLTSKFISAFEEASISSSKKVRPYFNHFFLFVLWKDHFIIFTSNL